MQITDIPTADFERIKSRLVQQINSMDEAEMRIHARTHESLGWYIADAFRALARAVGYIIAVPLAWGMRIAESIGEGFSAGWKSAFEAAGYD
jgi:hypothetical protein